MVKSYRDLIVWQKAMELVTEVYQATVEFPKEEIYGLTSQLRRAVVSIASNIAEGQGRKSRGEFSQFLGTSRGSLFEVETQIQIAVNLKYLSQTEADRLIDMTTEVARLLNGLLTSIRL